MRCRAVSLPDRSLKIFYEVATKLVRGSRLWKIIRVLNFYAFFLSSFICLSLSLSLFLRLLWFVLKGFRRRLESLLKLKRERRIGEECLRYWLCFLLFFFLLSFFFFFFYLCRGNGGPRLNRIAGTVPTDDVFNWKILSCNDRRKYVLLWDIKSVWFDHGK